MSITNLTDSQIEEIAKGPFTHARTAALIADLRLAKKTYETLAIINDGLIADAKRRRGGGSGWVIEREDSEPSRPMYFTGINWDYDNLKAVRFARKEDAQTMARYMFPGEPHRIADHMWCP
jgi:hypothetical protein